MAGARRFDRVHAAGSALLALALAGCSDEASGDAGTGGSGGAASSAAHGGAGSGGAGGEGGSGGAVTELVVESLVADPVLVLGLPATVTFTARVLHPDGPAAVTSATLWDGAKPYSFEPADPPGTWRRELTFQPGPDPDEGFLIFLGRFEDQSGAVAERTVGVQFDPTGCVGQPDPASCRACFCDQDPIGCAAFTALEHEHLYCGDTCTSACGAFCVTVAMGMADASLIDSACDACVPNIDDVGDFEDACIANPAVCGSFLIDAYGCGR